MTRGDFLVLITSGLLVGHLYKKLWHKQGEPSLVIIQSPFEAITMPLSEEIKTLTVKGYIGESVIEVSTQGVQFLTSPCQDKICLQAGRLHSLHASNICIPNGIGIYLKADDQVFDSINF